MCRLAIALAELMYRTVRRSFAEQYIAAVDPVARDAGVRGGAYTEEGCPMLAGTSSEGVDGNTKCKSSATNIWIRSEGTIPARSQPILADLWRLATQLHGFAPRALVSPRADAASRRIGTVGGYFSRFRGQRCGSRGPPASRGRWNIRSDIC